MGILVDLLVPPRCAACGAPSPLALCPECEQQTAAQILPDFARTELDDGVLAVGAYAYTGVIAAAIRGMKVAGRHACAPDLGCRLRTVLRLPQAADGVAVTWVPSTVRRLRQRGVELPRLLAGDGAVQLLRRVVERPDQTALRPADRRASPAGAFRATAPPPPAVVLVDDVRTTGATAGAAAAALRRAGARRVLVATLAVGGDAARDEARAGALRRAGRAQVAPSSPPTAPSSPPTAPPSSPMM